MRYCFGDYCLDTQRYELHRGRVPIPLWPKVYQVLAYLLMHHDRVVLTQELLEQVWPGQYVGDAALHSYIRDIRKALGDDGSGQRVVRTVRGRGYRFVASVEVQDPAPATPSLQLGPAPTGETAASTAPPPALPAGPLPAADPTGPAAPDAEGEHKLVTILCGALAEAPPLATQLGPERWYRLLQTVVGVIQEVLQPYAGTLTLTTSEGFTAVFGMPVAQEDHARRAVLAALELRHLILEAAQRQPLVLVVENLHWSDPTSEAWLASLVECLAGAAVLLLGTYRPGYQPPWGGHSAVTQVAPPPLHAQDSQTIVQAVLGAVPLPEARLRALVAQAGGNPFFLEELTWHAVEQGRGESPGAVPETVHAVLAARLDQLLPEEKRLIQTAAVIGTAVPWALLGAIANLPEEALHRGLAHLQAAEFLYETQVVPERTYTFKHALTHEVAYNSLLRGRRRVLHARVVEALEALSPERGAEQVDRLAHHALQGEVWDKAVTYCRQAGARVDGRAAFREAAASLDQALQALAHLPESREIRALAIDLRLALDPPLNQLGEHRRGRALLGEAEALARALNDRTRLGLALAPMALVRRQMGDHDGAIAVGRQALDLARQQKERGNEALALHQLGVVHAYADPSDVVRAEARYQQALALAEELGMRPLQAHCHRGLGTLYATTGRRQQARAALSTATEMYRAMAMTLWLPQAEAALAQAE